MANYLLIHDGGSGNNVCSESMFTMPWLKQPLLLALKSIRHKLLFSVANQQTVEGIEWVELIDWFTWRFQLLSVRFDNETTIMKYCSRASV